MKLFRLSCEPSFFRELLFLCQLDKKKWRDNISKPRHMGESPLTLVHSGVCIYLGFRGHLMRKGHSLFSNSKTNEISEFLRLILGYEHL